MSNVKLFDVRHSNVESQNYINLSVKLFDVQLSNNKCENDLNVERQTV